MNDSVNSMFRRSALGIGLVAAAVLAGCSTPEATPAPTGGAGSTGGMVTPPAGPTPGKEEFVNKVYPLLTSCAGCHITGVQGAPKYMTSDAATSYDTIKMFPRIFKKSADSSFPSKMAHSGAEVSDEVRAASKAWLDKEFPGTTVEDPGTTAPPVGGTSGGTGFNAAMAEFIRCMRQDDWEQNMKFYPMVQTNSFGPCAGCHEDGNAGTFLNADFNDTFEAMSTVPYVYRLVSPLYEGDSIADLAPNDRLITKGQITTDCFDPNNLICHDTYNVPKVQSQGLKFFQNSTLGRMNGLKCDEI
jgi:hypothetical protein